MQDRARSSGLALVAASLLLAPAASAVVTINWVAIGNPGNAADTPSSNCFAASCGSVSYSYFISKYEVTNAQYAEFLNAVDASGSNTLALYNASMDSDATFGGINFVSGNASGSKYVVKSGFATKPVTYVNFYDTLRFSNWLNNGQGGGSTETGAYTLLGGTATPSNGSTVTRNVGASIFLTSENEWYKAAYYSPGGVYFDYPVGTNTTTVCAAPTATANRANCNSEVGALTDVGAYTGSASPYGTYDQGGNVIEWNEGISSGAERGIRGGEWLDDLSLAASDPRSDGPTGDNPGVGFRVVSPWTEIAWVEVGDPANAADTTTGFGSVVNSYRISKTEVTNTQYALFLNAIAKDDPNGLYHASMGSGYGGITRSGSSPTFTYSVIVGRGDMPVNFVSFYNSLRFANWLHNGQPTGAQGNSTTEDGAYTFSGPTTVGARNAGAQIFLPSENEWYKAAYYRVPTASYFVYPTGSNTIPTCALPGATPNTANCDGVVTDLTPVGSYTGSASPMGTFDQGGNVWEWNEGIPGPSARSLRAGGFADPANRLAPLESTGALEASAISDVGFRVASISLIPPTVPSLSPIGMTVLWSLLGLAGLRSVRNRRSIA